MNQIRKIVVGALSFGWLMVSPLQAEGTIADLQDCHAVVSAWCADETAVAACDQATAPACDAQFDDVIGGITPYRLVATAESGGSYSVRFEAVPPSFVSLYDEDSDTF